MTRYGGKPRPTGERSRLVHDLPLRLARSGFPLPPFVILDVPSSSGRGSTDRERHSARVTPLVIDIVLGSQQIISPNGDNDIGQIAGHGHPVDACVDQLAESVGDDAAALAFLDAATQRRLETRCAFWILAITLRTRLRGSSEP